MADAVREPRLCHPWSGRGGALCCSSLSTRLSPLCLPPPPPQYSLCNDSLIELSNSGASGSLFYVSYDDEFIIKTVQHKEAEFLQKLLPGYYMVSRWGKVFSAGWGPALGMPEFGPVPVLGCEPGLSVRRLSSSSSSALKPPHPGFCVDEQQTPSFPRSDPLSFTTWGSTRPPAPGSPACDLHCFSDGFVALPALFREGADNSRYRHGDNQSSFTSVALSLAFQNLNQNPRTLLPKFYGLYCVQAGGKNIRIVVMNNLLPRSVKMHLKYDLKGSTYKRRASQKEREKVFPTYKDLDFMQDIPDGLFLDSDMYNALCKTLQRDCLVSGGVKGAMESHVLFLSWSRQLPERARPRTGRPRGSPRSPPAGVPAGTGGFG